MHRAGSSRGCRYATFTSTLGLDSTTDKKQKRLYKALGDAIREQVSPLIVQAYLQQLDGISHGRYCTPRVLHAYIFMLCEMCVVVARRRRAAVAPTAC